MDVLTKFLKIIMDKSVSFCKAETQLSYVTKQECILCLPGTSNVLDFCTLQTHLS